MDDALVYAPTSAVDCVGVILDRTTDRLHVLGSAVTLPTYVWALQHGFALHAPNTLVIELVRDLDAALELFRHAYKPRYVRDEIARVLVPASLPARIELDWPATALLLEPLRHSDVLTYQVER